MNFKSFIKKKMPVSFIVKRQRWKTLCLLKHEGKREFRRFFTGICCSCMFRSSSDGKPLDFLCPSD